MFSGYPVRGYPLEKEKIFFTFQNLKTMKKIRKKTVR